MGYYNEIKHIFENPNFDSETKERLIDAYVRIVSFGRAMKIVVDFKEAEINHSKFLERKNSSKHERDETLTIDK